MSAGGEQVAAYLARDRAVLWHGFTQMAAFEDNLPVVVERAEGRELVDVEGRRYFDAISSLWVTTLGHRVPELDRALVAQLGRVAHSTLLGNSNRVVIELAEALAEVVPVTGPHFLFASDGAAAVEQALKIAFQYWHNLGVRTRDHFLALGDAYHGDTLGSLSLGAGGFGTALFDPLRFRVDRTPGYVATDWADRAVGAIDAHHERLVAVVLEPLVQAAAGILTTSAEEVARVVRAAQRHGVLVIADEVATGFGRTGRLFALDHVGERVDLLCLGKGITGGYLPMSATVASDAVFSAFLAPDLSERTLYHGHSYGGNALAAAVALEHLRLVREPPLLEQVVATAATFAEALQRQLAGRREVVALRQRGLLIGVELAGPAASELARRVARGAVRRGVLLRSLGGVVPIVPPLTTTAEEAERVVAVLALALEEAVEEPRREVAATVTDGG